MIRTEINLTFAEAAFGALEAALADMSPVMTDIGEYMVASTKERFPTGTAPDGTKWAPKSPVTLQKYGAGKSNRVDPRPLFGPTGLLSQQIFHIAGQDQVEWGSNLIYSAVMQFGAAQGAFGTNARGSPIPWGRIPARPYLGVSAEDETMITETLSDWLLRAAGDTP